MVSTMKLSVGSQCVKYLMFVFNLLFVITGIILLSVGSVILGVYSEYFHFLDDKFLSVPNLLIATGAIIFFIAFFGCCGAVRESYCMIITFISLLVLVFIFELAGGISGYVLRDNAHDILRIKMLDSMKLYNETKNDYIDIWDNMQNSFDCCGTVNSTDWMKVFPNGSLPISCCTFNGLVETTKCNVNVTNIRKHGCLNTLQQIVASHAIELGGVGLGIASVQVLGIIFSVYLARAIKRSYETV